MGQLSVATLPQTGSDLSGNQQGVEYFYGDLLHILEKEQMTAYDRDRQCWTTYLDDPRFEAGALLRAAGFEVPGEWEAETGWKP